MATKGLSGPHLYWESMSSLERTAKFLIAIMNHIQLWKEGNIFDTNDKAYYSLRNIRSIHAHIARKMNDRDGNIEGYDVLWINQLGEESFISISKK